MNKKRNLVYYSSFGPVCPNNIFLTAAAIFSAKRFLSKDLDILLYSNVKLINSLNNLFPGILEGIKVWAVDYEYQIILDEASWARYEIFKWIDAENYSNFLYLDTDTIVTKDFLPIFSIISGNPVPLAVKHELIGGPQSPWYGKQIFDFYGKTYDVEKKMTFTTGALGFKNHTSVKNVFLKAQNFSRSFIRDFKRNHPDSRLHPFYRCDQPTMNYLLDGEPFINVGLLDDIMTNNPWHKDIPHVAHFPGGLGNKNKSEKVYNFLLKDTNRDQFGDIAQILRDCSIFQKALCLDE